MSTELLLQKIGVLFLLLSMIPGAWLGWREMRSDSTFGRTTFAILCALGLPCVIASIFLTLVLLWKAIEFIFS